MYLTLGAFLLMVPKMEFHLSDFIPFFLHVTRPVRRTFLFQKTFYCPWDNRTGLIPLPAINRYIGKGIETSFITGFSAEKDLCPEKTTKVAFRKIYRSTGINRFVDINLNRFSFFCLVGNIFYSLYFYFCF